MKQKLRALKERIVTTLRGLSFKTGLIVLGLCIPCYIISFAQMALDISYTMKGVLWVVFFGLAKTFQYAGLMIIGVEGYKKLKAYFSRLKNLKKSAKIGSN